MESSTTSNGLTFHRKFTATSTAAAVLEKEIREAVHAFEIRRVGNGASVLMSAHELPCGEGVEMKGKSGAWQVEAAGDRARRKTVWRVANQQAENVEPRLLSERAERIDRV